MTHSERMQPHSIPIEDIERSEDSLLCEGLADVFHLAAETDCYVTRALIAALEDGLGSLSEEDFRNMVAEVDDEALCEWFWQTREATRPRQCRYCYLHDLNVHMIKEGASYRCRDWEACRRRVTHPSFRGQDLGAAGLGGTEEDLSDLQRTGFARGRR